MQLHRYYPFHQQQSMLGAFLSFDQAVISIEAMKIAKTENSHHQK